MTARVGFALALLLLGALRHYVYKVAPLALQADVQNALTALAIVVGVVYVAWNERGWLVVGLVGWLAAEELQVFGCSAWYIMMGSPATLPGDQCTGLIGFDLGKVGLLAIAVLAHLSIRQVYRASK